MHPKNQVHGATLLSTKALGIAFQIFQDESTTQITTQQQAYSLTSLNGIFSNPKSVIHNQQIHNPNFKSWRRSIYTVGVRIWLVFNQIKFRGSLDRSGRVL